MTTEMTASTASSAALVLNSLSRDERDGIRVDSSAVTSVDDCSKSDTGAIVIERMYVRDAGVREGKLARPPPMITRGVEPRRVTSG
jgi:hypothetical protein